MTERPGFLAMLQRIAGNGIKTIIVESPDRFARDLAVQLAGHDMLKGLGIDLIPASAPDFFTEDTYSWPPVCGGIGQGDDPARVMAAPANGGVLRDPRRREFPSARYKIGYLYFPRSMPGGGARWDPISTLMLPLGSPTKANANDERAKAAIRSHFSFRDVVKASTFCRRVPLGGTHLGNRRTRE